ncbi:MAG TPA: methyltransferase domain-containing protein [Trebonia sp.]|jgi:SAM-dependent methyltransferase
MAELTDPWNTPAFLRDVQYRTDANLAARQSIYVYQHPRIDLQARVIDLAAPAPGASVADVGCGNGAYLAELARRGFAGRVLGLDMSPGMLAAARQRLTSVGPVGAPARSGTDGSADATAPPGIATAPPGTATAPGGVALICADATGLPLPDRAADLTLAMHMLYHVPDPSQAIRELRRVTRPGGRVVIGLNGPDHLLELREIVAAARGDGRWGRRERLTLDDGEALARSSFPTVARHDFAAELRLPDPQPIADYVRSMSGTQHGADPERLVAAVVSRFPAGPGAVLTVTTHTGCLICEV